MLDLQQNNMMTESDTLIPARKHKSSTLIAIPNNHTSNTISRKTTKLDLSTKIILELQKLCQASIS